MKVGLIGFTTVNLGDDVQAIATSLNLPYVDRLVLRDKFASLKLDERHFCLMQSWFTKQRLLAPSSAIDPLFFGFCFGGETMSYGLWPRYLRKYQPIGCRDTGSVARLKKLGIDAHWSGCLTLRIGSFLKPVPREERKGTYLVDLLPGSLKYIPEDIRARGVAISNAVPPAILDDPLARMSRIAKICDVLRRAELVVTKRLHTVLPSVGFGTPAVVFALNRKGNVHRFSGFEEFVPINFFGPGVEPKPVDWANVVPATIPAHLDARYAELRGEIASRLGGVGETQYDNLYRRDVITFPNPGLGHEAGRVAIDLGMTRVERVPLVWTEKFITVEIESYASFERFRAPLLVMGNRNKEWTEVGRIDQMIGASTVQPYPSEEELLRGFA
ncbi:polysaccharide pyruvyl transferase family protein [Methylobrevis albus]|uniref:Polysaccharide pyruvyl transferase family protein n=1 Tax=Methylobrevis albus TaxID=2793297 RepID=A0A931HZ94_9HYPH|nr:polysaccharide pyruvyl transferase family protein [Methylobrevis albus]MBH0236356.1 polysaccharide pyruvyl transferase family protein [Methylobrevis albus]